MSVVLITDTCDGLCGRTRQDGYTCVDRERNLWGCGHCRRLTRRYAEALGLLEKKASASKILPTEYVDMPRFAEDPFWTTLLEEGRRVADCGEDQSEGAQLFWLKVAGQPDIELPSQVLYGDPRTW